MAAEHTLACGTHIYLEDANGANVAFFVAQCGGTYLSIAKPGDPADPLWIGNGYTNTWQGVLAYLARVSRSAAATPPLGLALTGPRGGRASIGPQMSVSDLAGILGIGENAVRDELRDMLVGIEP
jgi:hypothetical protein